MKTIKLSVNGRKYRGLYEAVVDDVDYEFLNAIPWNPLIKNRTTGPYVRAMKSYRTPDGLWVTTFMHRVIFERAVGPISEGFTVDHVEQGKFGGLDNRRCNLRLATGSQQRANSVKRAGAVSGFKGIAKVKGASTWQAVVCIGRKNKHLGCFRSEEEAARAYDKGAREVFGEFALVNFPNEVTQ